MRLNLDPVRKRALANGAIAAFATLLVGIGVVSALEGEPTLDVASPSPSVSPTPAPPACVPSWEVVQSADPRDATMHALHGVAALAAGEAWAAGTSGDPQGSTQVLLERWDGVAWTAEAGPNPGSQFNDLVAIDASSPTDVWAVGRTASGFGDRPLALHYDGSSWLEVDLPDEVTGVLTGVAAIAADDVWVVGYTGDPDASLERATILHWDGQLWAIVDGGRAVGSGKSALFDVDALAPDDVWAVGYLHNQPLLVRFDGQRWQRTPADVRGTTNAIEAVTADDAWAVGAPIQRFTEGAWEQAANIRADGELLGVAAIGPTDVWAVGFRPNADGTTKALVVRFDGRRWRPVQANGGVPGSDALTDVDALADGTLLAVGYRDVQTGRRTLAVRGSTCLPEA